MWQLLTKDNGVLLISINDVECHYLKVLCDRLFGRDKFVTSLVWEYDGTNTNQSAVIRNHEHILVYSTTGNIDPPCVIDPNIGPNSKLFRREIVNSTTKNGPKNPPIEVFLPKGFPCSFREGSINRSEVKWPQYSDDLHVSGHALTHEVRAVSGWSSRKILERFIQSECQPVPDSRGNLTRFEISSTGALMYRKPRPDNPSYVLSVLRNMGTTQKSTSLLRSLGAEFSYAKPLKLVSYLLEAFSGPSDLILDAFAGSGTTGHAVMSLNMRKGSQRSCILIETDPDTVQKVTVPRLRAVVNGHSGAKIPEHGGKFDVLQLSETL